MTDRENLAREVADRTECDIATNGKVWTKNGQNVPTRLWNALLDSEEKERKSAADTIEALREVLILSNKLSDSEEKCRQLEKLAADYEETISAMRRDWMEDRRRLNVALSGKG